MPIRVLLMDIDDTLFDFQTSSYAALRAALTAFSLPELPGLWQRYSQLDAALWQQYERGEIEKETLYIERFRRLFDEYGFRTDAAAFNRVYFQVLGKQRNFMPHCEQVLPLLHERYSIYILTNGNTELQLRRIAASGLARYFDRVFISEQLGCKKPDRIFYDKVFREIGEAMRPQSIMIGDSLSSDMQGGRNAGIKTCLYGPRASADERCDYVVEDLLQLPELLAAL